jgi:hypothetical protein
VPNSGRQFETYDDSFNNLSGLHMHGAIREPCACGNGPDIHVFLSQTAFKNPESIICTDSG